MSDLFSNLFAQSLGSKVGVQPLVPPLFAPAPQLLSDAMLPSFNDWLAEVAENTIFSITPQIVASRTDTTEMEQPSDEVAPEKATILSDLVPPDIPQSAIDTYPQVNVAEDHASRSVPVYQLPRKADRASKIQAIQPQEATLPSAGNLEITSSSIPQQVQKHSAEKTSPTMPADSETQQPSPEVHPALPTTDAFHDQNLSTASGKPVAPLPMQSALSVSIASLQRDDLSEQRVSSDDVLDKRSSFVQPQIQSANYPASMERFLVPDSHVSEPASSVSKSQRRAAVNEQPEAASHPPSGHDGHTIKPLLDQNTVVKEQEELQSPSGVSTHEGIAQSAKSRLGVPVDSEFVHQIFPANLSNAQDALHSSRADAKLEAHGMKAESEVFPINITIGRVVVRATQAAQPTQVKKRVLRPAQSLDEYLKQRERGSR